MSIASLFQKPDMQSSLEQFRNTDGAVLLDVRTPGEYAGGHIPGSKNLPLQSIFDIAKLVPDVQTPVFVYCQSGARSHRAAAFLKKSGYAAVTDLGGITAYHGTLEK